VVGYGCYCNVDDSLAHNSQETIITPRIASFVVKTVKQELKVDDILPQCFDVLASPIFIEFFGSLVGEDLTPPFSLTKSSKGIFQSRASLSLEPSTHVGSIQSIISCLCAMVLPKQTSNELKTLDYDNIFLQKVQFLPIIFDGGILFKLPPIHSNAYNFSQMQGMDRKYNGHAWSKLVTTNIKNSFGLSFRKACCLGHL